MAHRSKMIAMATLLIVDAGDKGIDEAFHACYDDGEDRHNDANNDIDARGGAADQFESGR